MYLKIKNKMRVKRYTVYKRELEPVSCKPASTALPICGTPHPKFLIHI
jgi:hypothetical protein